MKANQARAHNNRSFADMLEIRVNVKPIIEWFLTNERDVMVGYYSYFILICGLDISG
jgi:hypothetical protein